MGLESINKITEANTIEKKEFSDEYLEKINKEHSEKIIDRKNREKESFQKDENILFNLDSQLNSVNSFDKKDENKNLNVASSQYLEGVRDSFNNKNENVFKRVKNFFTDLIG